MQERKRGEITFQSLQKLQLSYSIAYVYFNMVMTMVFGNETSRNPLVRSSRLQVEPRVENDSVGSSSPSSPLPTS